MSEEYGENGHNMVLGPFCDSRLVIVGIDYIIIKILAIIGSADFRQELWDVSLMLKYET